MPGNEVGERIHNFFGQDNLNQGQHQSQVVDGTWSGLNNNLWVGSQRQIGVPLISSNLKSYSVQPSGNNHAHLDYLVSSASYSFLKDIFLQLIILIPPNLFGIRL